MRSSLVCVALMLAGCEDPAPEVIWSGELVDYTASPQRAATLCAGTGPRVDEAAVRIADRLGLANPRRFTYHWIPDGFEDAPCLFAAGCAEPGVVWSQLTMIEHEVAHVYAFEYGFPDPFLVEGLAEYLGGTFTDATQNDPAALIGLGHPMSSPAFYSTAGRFVASAVALSSLPQVLDLYEASDYFDPPEAFANHLREATGLTVDDIAAHGRAEPRCPSLVYREDLVVCAAEATEISAEIADPIAVEAPVDCADTNVWGRQGALRTDRAIEVVAGGKFKVVVDPDSKFILTPCTPGCDVVEPLEFELQEAEPGEESPGQVVRLPRGRYGLRIRRSEPGTARIEFSR